MIRHPTFVVAALLATTIGASAQTYVLPEIGIQNSGASRLFSLRDRSNNGMVPFGALNTTTHRLDLGTLVDVTTPNGGTQSLGAWLDQKAPTANPFITGTMSATQSGACDSTAWTGYFGGTLGPVPRDYCSKAAGSISILYPGLNGLGNEGGAAVSPGDTTYMPMAQHLVQAVTTQDNTRQETGLGINFRNRTGGGGLPQTQHNQKVALSVFARAEPGGSNMWGINTDVHALSGVGNYLLAGREADHTNFNGDYAPGGCTSCQPGQINNVAWGDWMSFVGYPMTAGTYYSGFANPPAPFNGTLTAGSNTITNAAIIGGNGNSRLPYFGETLTSGGSIPPGTRVTAVSGTTVTMSQAATSSGYTQVTTAGYNLHYGMLFAAANGFTDIGTGLIGDTTINDSSNSPTTLMVYGNHVETINTTNATVARVITAKQGQAICLNGVDGCLAYAGSNVTRYTQNGGYPLTMIGSAGGVNGVVLTSAATGFGPQVKPDGPDASIPLNLTGKNAPVQVLSGLVVNGAVVISAGVNAAGLPTAGVRKGALCIDTSNNVYVATGGAC